MKRLFFILAILVVPCGAWAGNFSTTTTDLVADYTSGGFIWFSDGTDVSAYGSGVTGTQEVTIRDSLGNEAKADGGNAGSGTTTTVVIKEDDCSADNTVNWTDFDATLSFEGDHYELTKNSASWGSFLEGSCTDGAAYVSRYDVHQGTLGGDSVGFYWSLGGAVASADFKATSGVTTRIYSYRTAEGTIGNARSGMFSDQGANGEYFRFVNFSWERILTPGATGLYVTNWKIDSGFDYNDASGYTVEIERAGKGKIRSRNRRGR